MKTTISVGLCFALSAGAISLHATDTPAQAAARALLEQTLKEMDRPKPQPPSGSVTNVVAGQTGKSAAKATETVP
jgi:hypothetical protein